MLTPDATRTAEGVPRAGAWALRVIGEGAERRVALPERGVVIVGRDATAELRLDDREASRLHVRLVCDAAKMTVSDLGSKNGSALNGVPLGVEPRAVVAGDVLRCASTILVVETTPPSAGPAPGPARGDDVLHVPLARGLWSVADPAMKALVAVAGRLAASPLPVLVLGETGVGKEGLASLIHARSQRANGPFVAINCAALPPELVESELFGHLKGAFTGATSDKRGLFEAAHGGTLFLDEVGDLAVAAQAKLLRALDHGYIRRVGEAGERQVDVRVVAATHRNLGAAVAAGRFREDLWYRLAVSVLDVPPLRARPHDVRLLAERFLADRAPRLSWSPAALARLLAHAWPGNVRELQNTVDYVAAIADGPEVRADDLPTLVRGDDTAPTDLPLDATLATVERQRIIAALAAEGGNQTRAAARLGMPRRTFLRRLKRYAIAGPR